MVPFSFPSWRPIKTQIVLLVRPSFCSCPPAEPILPSRPTRIAIRRAQRLSRTRTSRAREGLSLTAASTAAGWDASGDQLAQYDGRFKLERNELDQALLYGPQLEQRRRQADAGVARFPVPLPNFPRACGNGNWKCSRFPIKCLDFSAIKERDQA